MLCSTVKLSPNGINGLAAPLQFAVQTLSSGGRSDSGRGRNWQQPSASPPSASYRGRAS